MSSDTEYIRRGCIAVLTECAGKAQRAIGEVGSGWKPILANLPKDLAKIEADVKEAEHNCSQCLDALARLKELKEVQNEQ